MYAKRRRKQFFWCWLFVLPTTLFYAAFQAWPILSSIYYSTLDWSGISSKKNFVGLANFAELFKDQWFWNAFANSFKYMVFSVPPLIIISLLLAAIPGVEVTQGSPDNVEATAAGVNKGSALLALARHFGISRESVLAIGDSENDRRMLEAAGVAAVMSNGMPSIQSLADILSEQDCDHDGVAELFDRLGLTAD